MYLHTTRIRLKWAKRYYEIQINKYIFSFFLHTYIVYVSYWNPPKCSKHMYPIRSYTIIRRQLSKSNFWIVNYLNLLLFEFFSDGKATQTLKIHIKFDTKANRREKKTFKNHGKKRKKSLQ